VEAGADAGTVTGGSKPGDAGSEASTDGGSLGPPTSIFVQSPDIAVAAGEQKSFCYYFHTNNTTDLDISMLDTTVSANVEHMAVIFTTADDAPVNTVSSANCAFLSPLTNHPSWVFSTFSQHTGWRFPLDDGNGKYVARKVPAGQSGYLLIQALNPTAGAVMVNGRFSATAYNPPIPPAKLTYASSFAAVDTNINLPPNAVNSTWSATCPAPSGANFAYMTMYTHKDAVKMSVMDGAQTLVQSTDFSNPDVTQWNSAPFLSPANPLTYSCTYNNPTGVSVTQGASRVTNENCMVLSYFFPATTSRLCVNNILLP
jgi:hypothetical protein